MSTNYHTISHILLDNRSSFFLAQIQKNSALPGTFFILFIFFVLFACTLCILWCITLNYTIIKKIPTYTSIIRLASRQVLRLHCIGTNLFHSKGKKETFIKYHNEKKNLVLGCVRCICDNNDDNKTCKNLQRNLYIHHCHHSSECISARLYMPFILRHATFFCHGLTSFYDCDKK